MSLRRIILLLLTACVIAACSPQPAPPTPEPVLPRRPTSTPPPAPPTSTPIPLNQSTPAPANTPAQMLPTGTLPPAQPAQPAQPATLPTAGCLASQGGPTRLPGQRVGVNIYADNGSFERALDLARDTGAGWVRVKMNWNDIEPQRGAYQWSQVDALAAGAEARGLRVLLAISNSPAWATANGAGGLPDNPTDLGTFTGALATHAQGRIAAYEIWPNPNSAAANGGVAAEPDQYVEALKAAYQSIKAANPCALVLNGALLPNAARDKAVALDDLVYYRDLVAYNNGEFGRVHDILAIQLNTGGAQGRGKWPREAPAQSRNYYGHAEIIRDEMTAADQGDHQAWVVETGHRVEGENAVSPEQQGEYLAELFPLSRKAYPWMSGIFVRDIAVGAVSGEQAAFNLVNPDGSPRPAYDSLQDYATRQREESSRVVPIYNTDRFLLWWFTPFDMTERPLVIGPDNAIYSTTEVGFIRVTDQNGAFHAFTRFSKKKLIGVAVDQQLNVYATSSVGTIAGVSRGGAYLWDQLTDGTAATNLVVSPDGRALYFGTDRERLDAYATADGSKLWEAPLGGIPGDVTVGADGTIYVGATDDELHAIGPDGVTRWRYPAGSRVITPVVAGTTIYGVTEQGAAFALAADGSQIWRAELGAVGAGIAVEPGGTAYVSTRDSALHALNASGQPVWQTQLNGGPPTAPAVASDGRIYLGAEDGNFRMIMPDGTVAGMFNFQKPLRIAPVAGKDGVVFQTLPKDDAALVAFGSQAVLEQYRAP